MTTITETTDWPADMATPASFAVDASNPFVTFEGQLQDATDEDWIAIHLEANLTYRILITADFDPYMSLETYFIASDEEGWGWWLELEVAGEVYEDGIVYWYKEPDDYYIKIKSLDHESFGNYRVDVDVFWYATPTVMADVLTTSYWVDYRGEQGPRPFAIGEDGQITFDASALSGQLHDLVVDALDAWGRLIGVQFVESPGSAEVQFQLGTADDVDLTLTDGKITAASVTLNDASLDAGPDATYEMLLHLVGHVLGLGHPGNYDHDGSAVFIRDADFANDGVQMSVMSAFSAYDSLGAAFAHSRTPMVADVAALDSLYGLSDDLNAGDTVYGYNSEDPLTDPSQWTPEMSYGVTIVDSGGVDTLDLSGNPRSTYAVLQPGGFSDLGGGYGNLGIAEGTIIENYVGGAQSDDVIGNDAANVINVGEGDDSVFALGGDDVVIGWYGNDELNGGNGNDTLLGGGLVDILKGQNGADRLYGQNGNDTLDGGNGADRLKGNDGDDQLDGGRGSDLLFGGDGDDTLRGGPGVDKLWGGAGQDTFVSAPGSHREIVKDFEDDIDVIDLSAWGFASVADAMSHAAQMGTAVRFDFSSVAGSGGYDVFWVMNTTISALQDDIVI